MGTEQQPLVVDLDGTLLKTDTLCELVFFAIRANPLNLFRIFVAALRGRPNLKSFVGRFAAQVVPTLPTNPQVIELVRKARIEGRPVYLATASSSETANEVNSLHGPFEGVFASSERTNLKGLTKARALDEYFGPHGFDYVGNEAADISVFRQAATGVLVGGGASLLRRARLANSSVAHLPAKGAWRDLWDLARPYQWVKNFLLFVPAVGAKAFDLPLLWNLCLGFLALSAVASALYVLNDLLDVADDRTHPTKRYRPLAQGNVSVSAASVLSGLLTLLGILIAFSVSPLFLAVLGAYSLLALAYSLFLKRLAVLDVFGLASLYAVRLIGGAVIANVALSPWLMSFSFFVFLFLALAKRYVEITDDNLEQGEKVRGRGYKPSDSNLVGWAGVSVGVVSAMLLALYVEDRAGSLGGRSVDWSWGMIPLWLYWVLRTWLKAFRSELEGDPVVYALRDRMSLLTAIVLLVVFVVTG